MEPITSVFTAAILRSFLKSAADARAERETYTQKLEEAQDDDIFRYLLLISTSGLDEYVSQTRLQAAQNFRQAGLVAFGGFLILATGIGFGIYMTLTGGRSLDAAYLAAISGVLVEFIAGVQFWMYSQTLRQINIFHSRMLASQHVAISLTAGSLVENVAVRDEQKSRLAAALMNGSRLSGDEPAAGFPSGSN